MKPRKFIARDRFKSFKYAFNGLRLLFYEEHNARIHATISLIVLLAGFVLRISVYEWVALCFAIGFVFTTEILNTAIENLGDYISVEQTERMKKIKDLSAAAVLVSVCIAVVIGVLILGPAIIDV